MSASASLAAFLRVILWVFIGTCAALVLLQATVLASGNMFNVPELLTLALGGVNVIMMLTFVASIIVTGLWVHRAHTNLHEGGVGGLNYSPGWATASFYIPLINLYVPFASTRELFNRSHGESDWHAGIPAGDVTSWAACNWAALLMFIVIAGYAFVDSIQFVHVIMPLWAWLGLAILLYVFLAGSAYYLLRIVEKITAAQIGGLHHSQSDVFD